MDMGTPSIGEVYLGESRPQGRAQFQLSGNEGSICEEAEDLRWLDYHEMEFQRAQ